MERFDPIYPFTTENIAGYMKELSLKDKKIITVTGSSDHALNAILQGATDITTFDINKKAELYLYLKLAAVKQLPYSDFCNMLLYDTKDSFHPELINQLVMPQEIKKFWIQELQNHKNNGLALKKSSLFQQKYFNSTSKKQCNLYLERNAYATLQERISSVKITFINKNLKELVLSQNYDYLFLSNIADYLSQLYEKEELASYQKLITTLNKKVETIYFAYLYDIGNQNPRSSIDRLADVSKLFPTMEIKKFPTCLEQHNKNIQDGVLILKKGEKKYG